jgi:acyl-CoA thioester hydrolase
MIDEIAKTELDWHETPVRVRYAETDKMGVVYHANYLVWFEIGRTEFCRAKGITYRDMENVDGAYLVVAESYCRYKSAAYYDDELTIRTRIHELKRRTLCFEYEVFRKSDEKLIAQGETIHVVTDTSSKVISFPEHYREMLLRPFADPLGAEDALPESAPE